MALETLAEYNFEKYTNMCIDYSSICHSALAATIHAAIIKAATSDLLLKVGGFST